MSQSQPDGLSDFNFIHFSPVGYEEASQATTNLEDVMRTTMCSDVQPNSMDELFAQRKLIYENKDLFYNITSEHQQTDKEQKSDLVDASEQQLIADISMHVKRGIEMIVKELHTFNVIKDDIENLETSFTQGKRAVDSIRDNFKLLCNMYNPTEDSNVSFEKQLEPIRNAIEMRNNDIRERKRKLHICAEKIRLLSDVYRVVKNANVFYTCPICLTRDVTHFLTSCGHTMCEECSAKLSVKCFICRRKIERVQNLFFS